MALNWSIDVRAADWLVERIAGFAVDVGSIVPTGSRRNARVFHPLDEGPDRRWTDRAARNGRTLRGPTSPAPRPCRPG